MKKKPATKEEQGLRYNSDKPRMSLIDSFATIELAKVLTKGAIKYAPHNWRKGLSISECIDSLDRHLKALNDPHASDYDGETKLHHAAHIMCNAMFILWLLIYKPECDDRFKISLTKVCDPNTIKEVERGSQPQRPKKSVGGYTKAAKKRLGL